MKRILNKLPYLFCILFFFLMGSEDTQAKGLIINDYSINSDAAMYGEKGTITVNIENTEEVFVSDVLVTFTTSDLFYPVYGNTNQIYIGTLEANEKKTITFDFEISERAKGILILPIMMEYYIGPEGASDSNYVTVTVPVGDLCEYSIKGLTLEQNATNASQVMLSVSSGNDGNTMVYNLNMHLVGDVLGGEDIIQLGDVEPGVQLYDDYYVSFDGNGDKTIQVYFSYQDVHGKEYVTDAQTLTTTIEKKTGGGSDFVISGADGESYDEASQIILLCGILVLFIIVIVIVMRWRKK